MNQKSIQQRAHIIQLLIEGNSIRGAARIAHASKDTVMSLLVHIGAACREYQDKHLIKLPCKTIQVDEIHSFIYAKDKNVPEGVTGIGTVWTWVAIDCDTKLIPCWRIGGRDKETAQKFIHDLHSRLSEKIQLSSDGLGDYVSAVEDAFGIDVDYGMVIKTYEKSARKRQKFIAATKQIRVGRPDMGKISTSYIERQNLTMRMHIKRFARRTNAHSKKLYNHECAVALHFMYYNFCRIHQSLRITPAMAAGLTDRVWDIEDIIALME